MHDQQPAVLELLATINSGLGRAKSTDRHVLACEVAIAQVLQGGEDPGAASKWLRATLDANRLPDESELPRLRPDESVWTPAQERPGHRHQLDEQ